MDPRAAIRPAAHKAANLIALRQRFVVAANNGNSATSRNQFTAATCLKAIASAVRTPQRQIDIVLREFSTALRNAIWERIRGSNMKISVLAAVPSASGSTESKVNRTAAANAQNSFVNLRARKNSAQLEAAENSNAAKWIARIGSTGKVSAAR